MKSLNSCAQISKQLLLPNEQDIHALCNRVLCICLLQVVPGSVCAGLPVSESLPGTSGVTCLSHRVSTNSAQVTSHDGSHDSHMIVS